MIKGFVIKIFHLWGKIRIYFCNIINRIQFAVKNVRYGKNSKIFGIVTVTGTGKLVLGENVEINSAAWKNRIGGDIKTVFSTFENGLIEVGNDSGISNSTLVARDRITIGNFVNIGGNCKIYDNDFHSLNFEERKKGIEDKDIAVKPVCIKDGAFIGAHCIILKGVTVGEYSVVGAGSVVTKDIPDYEIWAGNPAKKVGSIER